MKRIGHFSFENDTSEPRCVCFVEVLEEHCVGDLSVRNMVRMLCLAFVVLCVERPQ